MIKIITQDITVIEKVIKELAAWKRRWLDDEQQDYRPIYYSSGMSESDRRTYRDHYRIINSYAFILTFVLEGAVEKDDALTLVKYIMVPGNKPGVNREKDLNRILWIIDELEDDLLWALVSIDLN